MNCRFSPLFFWLILALLLHAQALLAEGPAKSPEGHLYSYTLGNTERIVYRASWNGIPIASAVIHGGPLLIEGKKYYQVKVQVRTWKYLELFWKMRDSIESIFNVETFQPHRFIFRQRENRRKIDTTAVFDPGSDKWLVYRRRGTKVKNYEFVSRHTFDPISATYLARRLDFSVGNRLQLEVFGGKSRYLVTLDIVGQERITVRAGDFDAYKIIPRVFNLTRSGYAKRVRRVTIWISTDEKKRPIKVVSQVFIGSVEIELVEEKT